VTTRTGPAVGADAAMDHPVKNKKTACKPIGTLFISLDSLALPFLSSGDLRYLLSISLAAHRVPQTARSARISESLKN